MPKGGKPILESLARDVIEKDISDTLIAIDADYDQFRNRQIADNRVLYTYGYSWENDVFCTGALEGIYRVLCHSDATPKNVLRHMKSSLTRLRRELRLPVKADFYALCAGSSVLPRGAPGRVIDCNGEVVPTVKTKEVMKLLGSANQSTKPRTLGKHDGPPRDYLRHCVGHIYAFVICALVRATIRAHHGPSTLTLSHLRDVGILTFSSFLLANPNARVARHHHRQCQSL